MKNIHLISLILLVNAANAFGQISGATTIQAGTQTVYSYTDNFTVLPSWTIATGSATIDNTWLIGDTYYAAVTWTSTGVNTIRFLDNGGIMASLNVTVNMQFPIGAAASRCGTGTVTLSATPGIGGDQVIWFTSSSNFALSVHNGLSYTTASISSTTTFYIATYNSVSGLSTTKTPIVATVVAAPGIPTGVTAGSRCGTGSVTLSATAGSGSTGVRWYADPVDNTVMSSASSYSPSLSSTVTYYVSSYNSSTGCESSRQSVVATVNPIPSWPNTNDTFICGSGTANLIATTGVYGTTVKWYSASSGGSPLATGTSYSASVSSNTIYYASSFNATTGCESATPRRPVPVTVQSVPSAPTAITSSTARFGKGHDTLRVTGSPEYRWYTNSLTLLPDDSLDTFIPYLSATTSYKVKAINEAGCESTALTITANVIDLPLVDFSGSTFKNSGETLTFSVPDIYETYQWMKDGVNISAATTNSYTASATGSYAVHVTLDNGRTYESLPMRLTVYGDTQQSATPVSPDNNAPPNITVAPRKNFVRTYTANKEDLELTDFQLGNFDPENVMVSTGYMDGLGMPVQSVQKEASPLGRDVIAHSEYDTYGRTVKEYLPFTSGTTPDADGYHKNAKYEQYYFYRTPTDVTVPVTGVAYSEKIFEPSPLNRIVKQTSPGESWKAGSGREVLMHARPYYADTDGDVIHWEVNAAGELVKTTLYTDGRLNVAETRDENGMSVWQYTNRLGQVILKQVQADGHTRAQTYYVYDRLGNLRFVLPPELINNLPGNFTWASHYTSIVEPWAFQYTYDKRKRMTTKRVPGSGTVYMVYDKLDRVVLTQDANQRSGSNKYWSFTKYDKLNRPVLTGIHTADSVLSQAKMQRRVNAFYGGSGILFESVGSTVHGYTNQSYPSESIADNYLTVTYYDTYAFKTTLTDSSSYSFMTNHVSGQDVTYFMRLTGQVTGMKVKVLDGGITGGNTWLKTINYYDNRYRVIQSVSDNYKQGRDRITNVYDFTGKVLKSKSSHMEFDIGWKDVTSGVSRHGERMYRSAGGSSDDQGAASTAMLPANADGWFEFTHSNSNMMYIGLSDANTNASYTTIDYCLRVGGGSSYAAIASGGSPVVPGTHLIGDVFRIERVSGTVRIRLNGTVTHTFSGTSTSALLVDVSFNGGQAAVQSAKASFAASANEVLRTFTYDHADRLLDVWHQVNQEDAVLLVKNEYNELGQLIDKKLHSADGSTFKQSIDHAYNIRGWLTKINESDLSVADEDAGRDLFGMQLGYNEDIGTSNDPLFNGNISSIKWSNNLALGDVAQNAYLYSYDALNRLKTSIYKEEASATWATADNYANQETGFVYDLNGNIAELKRNDRRSTGWMDNLTYSYGAGGNRLLKVTDSGDKTKGFKDVASAGDDYVYDANGNLIWDRNKSGVETLVNNSFDNGNANWSVTNSSRLTFTNGEVQIATGGSQSTLQQSVIRHNNPYVVVIDLERTSGTLEIYVGSTLATFNTTGTHTVTLTAGANSNFSIVTTTGFAGKIKSISLKGATTITYNFLNLPEIVTRAGDKQLQYIYDATGRKLRQEVTNNSVLEKSTDYSGEYIYENDTLQFINHEEGRIITLNGVEGGFEYQYHLKDHLGNVRLTFTSKHEADTAVATLETVNIGAEQSQFLYYDEAVRINSTIFDHTNNGATNYALRLTGVPNHQYGLAKSISVMPGDTIRATVYAKYLESDTTEWNPGGFTTFMNTIRWGTPGVGVLVDGGLTGSTGGIIPPVGSLANKGDGAEDGAPKAYLNFLVFNRQDSLIDGGFVAVTEVAREYGQDGAHEELFKELLIKEPGYVYLYLSNDNAALGGNVIEVFFDDFTVEHVKSPVVQQDDYYAFGLNFNSYQRENATANKWKFQGQEHITDLDLGWDSFKWRNYLPDIGRFFNVDPLADKYVYNSVYAFSENRVIDAVELEGLEKVLVNEKDDQLIYNVGSKNQDKSAIHVYAHGNQKGFTDESNKQSNGKGNWVNTKSEFIQVMSNGTEKEQFQSRSEDNPAVVILHSCRTGRSITKNGEKTADSAAEIFSEVDNTIVVAPTERDYFTNILGFGFENGPYVNTNTDENGSYEEYDKKNEPISDKSSTRGEWVIYKGGTEIGRKPGDWTPNGKDIKKEYVQPKSN